MEFVDVTDWEKDATNPAGNRIKIWLIHPLTKERYLFKEPKTEGEMIGEVASYNIGVKLFGLSIPETQFAKQGIKRGSISKSFILEKDKGTIEFQEIVDYFGEDFDELDLNQYTLDKALTIVEELDCKSDFFDMVLFDFLIANQDRHAQNWGILTDRKTKMKFFSPLYDNGSSLFSGYDDRKLEELAKDSKSFQAYTNRAKSLFFLQKKKPKFLNVLTELYKNDEEMFKISFERFQTVEEDKIFDLMKNTGLNDIRSKVIARLICYRVTIIGTLIEEKEVD